MARRLTAHNLIAVMGKLEDERGLPEHIRSDNGSEFIARVLQQWLARRRVKALYIEPGSPWQNGHVESFNGSLRDECPNRDSCSAPPHKPASKLWTPVTLRAPYAQSLNHQPFTHNINLTCHSIWTTNGGSITEFHLHGPSYLKKVINETAKFVAESKK